MEIVNLNISELIPYRNNPRRNDAAVDKVAASIKEFGFKVPIVVDKNGVIVAGHTRLKAAKMLNMESVPCIIADDLTEEQVNAFRLADNKVGELAEWDYEMLLAELNEIDTEFDMSEFGFDEEKKNFWGDAESESNEEYEKFTEKFKPKLTTDDCYTPPNIYDAVKKWVVDRYGLHDCEVVRPFYPGGDYKTYNYPDNCTVIDNPPFSILSEICDFYNENKIAFFMFAPALTLFSTNSGKSNYLPCSVNVTYENGANVNTSFVTNIGNVKIEFSPELYTAIKEQNDLNIKENAKELPKYEYPDEVITSTKTFARYGITLKINERDCYFTRSLDSQKEHGKGIFGTGFLLSRKAAAEKAAAEKAAAEKAVVEKAEVKKWQLSEREIKIIESLGKETE